MGSGEKHMGMDYAREGAVGGGGGRKGVQKGLEGEQEKQGEAEPVNTR